MFCGVCVLLFIVGDKSKKVFNKNSSLVTMPLNELTDRRLKCDELKIQLVTWGFLGYYLEVKVDSF